MATYTNLTSLASLQVGDVVNYTNSTVIDFGGKNVNIKMYGISGSSQATGGYVEFDFNTSSLSSKIFYYNSGAGSSLIRTSSATFNPYYRIAVPGDAGYTSGTSGGRSFGSNYGKGGGLTGGTGNSHTYSSSSKFTGATGGSQIAGGTGGVKTGSGSGGSAGAFAKQNSGNYLVENGGYGGSHSYLSYNWSGGQGGAGWYGGGGGAALLNGGNERRYGCGGGGSGFIIGQSTNTYPSGYMGDQSAVISELEAAVSNGTLTQGGSSETSSKMVITVLTDPVPTLSSISIATNPTKTSYYTGDTFSSAGLTIYANWSNGTQTTVSSGFTTSSPDMSTAGTKSVTVSYTVDGITQTTSYNITVTALTVTSISLSGNYQTVFTEGDAFSASGLVVTASYNNGSSAVISSGYSITSPNMSQVGTQTVTVSYSGQTASYTITVNAAFTPGMKYYDGTNFVLCDVYYYNGTNFVKCEPYYYNGSEFVELGDTN